MYFKIKTVLIFLNEYSHSADGGDEHGDEQSVGEDSGGGDDAESDEGSMNSAEAIEGDGNQLHDRLVFVVCCFYVAKMRA